MLTVEIGTEGSKSRKRALTFLKTVVRRSWTNGYRGSWGRGKDE